MVRSARCVPPGASQSVACKSVQPPSGGCQSNDSLLPHGRKPVGQQTYLSHRRPSAPRNNMASAKALRQRRRLAGAGLSLQPCPDRCSGTSRVGAPVEQSAHRVPGRYPLYLPKWAPSVRRSGRGRGQLAVRVRASPRCRGNGERCAGGAPASAMPTTWPRRVALALMPFCAPGPGRSGMLRFGPYGADSQAFRGHNFGPLAQKISIKIILDYNLCRNADISSAPEIANYNLTLRRDTPYHFPQWGKYKIYTHYPRASCRGAARPAEQSRSGWHG